jgi:adenosylhomocysteine nucleosidase
VVAPIGILCALEAERALLVAALTSVATAPGAGFDAQVGRLDGRHVVVATCGVGKVNAAITATLLVERLGCGALVLSGVAGGLSADLTIGDLVVADRLVDVDYGRIADGGRIVYQPGTLPLPEVEAAPGYVLPVAMVEAVNARLGASARRAVTGTILSGDAFLASARVRDELAARWSALAIEMEGAAVCGVAERFDIPWLIVRALSDRAGEESVTDFAAFVRDAADASAGLVRTLLPLFDP